MKIKTITWNGGSLIMLAKPPSLLVPCLKSTAHCAPPLPQSPCLYSCQHNIYLHTDDINIPLPLDRAHFHLSIGFSKAYATINVSWDLWNQFLRQRSRRAIHFIPNPLDFTSLHKWVRRKNVQVRLLIKSHIFLNFVSNHSFTKS